MYKGGYSNMRNFIMLMLKFGRFGDKLMMLFLFLVDLVDWILLVWVLFVFFWLMSDGVVLFCESDVGVFMWLFCVVGFFLRWGLILLVVEWGLFVMNLEGVFIVDF